LKLEINTSQNNKSSQSALSRDKNLATQKSMKKPSVKWIETQVQKDLMKIEKNF
jgi:hypothetical protein